MTTLWTRTKGKAFESLALLSPLPGNSLFLPPQHHLLSVFLNFIFLSFITSYCWLLHSCFSVRLAEITLCSVLWSMVKEKWQTSFDCPILPNGELRGERKSGKRRQVARTRLLSVHLEYVLWFSGNKCLWSKQNPMQDWFLWSGHWLVPWDASLPWAVDGTQVIWYRICFWLEANS